MKKIPTIFKRNPENMKELLDEPHPDCLWVFAGEGYATRKYDGTCVLFENGIMYKRRTIKLSKYKPGRLGKIKPSDYIEVDYDSVTGKSFGWQPVQDTDKFHLEALSHGGFDDGTYELLGPKIQGNHEKFVIHDVIRHKYAEQYPSCPRTFEWLKIWLRDKDIEGIVFHHCDGRMGKIKKRDFGLCR